MAKTDGSSRENSPKQPQKSCYRPTRAGQQDRVSGWRKQTVFEGKQPKTTAEIMFSADADRPAGPGLGLAKTDGFSKENSPKPVPKSCFRHPGRPAGPGVGMAKTDPSSRENSPKQPQKSCYRPTRAGQQDRVSGWRKHTVFEGKQPKTTAEIMFSADAGRPAGPGLGLAKTDGFRRKTAQNNRRTLKVTGLPGQGSRTGCRVGENRRFLKENSPKQPQKSCYRPTEKNIVVCLKHSGLLNNRQK